jgi:hypothetical protein
MTHGPKRPNSEAEASVFGPSQEMTPRAWTRMTKEAHVAVKKAQSNAKLEALGVGGWRAGWPAGGGYVVRYG